MNRIDRLFEQKKNDILSVYFTAGHPHLDSTVLIIKALTDAGVDMIEIGMPFSDPMADGPVIQHSSNRALQNGMRVKLLFEQLKDIRKQVDIPLLLMGYLNPVLQYGFAEFCKESSAVGIDGLILPDLPPEVFEGDLLLDTHLSDSHTKLSHLFGTNNLRNIFLITPQTPPDRIRLIDALSKGFIYMVSSSSTTGVKGNIDTNQILYFERIRNMKLKNPVMAGFGISNNENYKTVCRYAAGAIIGSAFVKALSESKDLKADIREFVLSIRSDPTK
jgi:tryptophan synthase alpha chain